MLNRHSYHLFGSIKWTAPEILLATR